MNDPGYLIAPLIAFVAAQGIKYFLLSFANHKAMPAKQILASGNMPSGHTATLVAVDTLLIINLGIDHPIVALALVLTGLTMYDALNSRRATGEIGLLVAEFFAKKNKNQKPLRVALGHKPLEVLAGALLGVLIALIVYVIDLSVK